MYGEVLLFFILDGYHGIFLGIRVCKGQSKRGDAVVICKAVSEKGAPLISKMDFQWIPT